ncbi:MAG: tetratricopeptide repeat protein [candidate division WS1 bacterium]|jgi:tetratricopeptide (TPR) repeat protein|nr:tetratricopeptide repeat protein [candidate division WS1 bacterium]
MDLRIEAGRQELGKRIQSAIMEADYDSLPAFAEHVGMSRALIYQYVKGTVLVQLDRLQEIAEATGKPLEWFLATDPHGATQALAQMQVTLAERDHALAEERKQRLEQVQEFQQEQLRLLRELTASHRRTGEKAAMLESALRWRELARQAGDEVALMESHLYLGHAWYTLGDLEQAEQALREALEHAEALKRPAARYSAQQELIRVLQAQGRLLEASELAVEASVSELWWPQWAGLVSLAAMEEQMGELKAAGEHLAEAREVVTQADEPVERRLAATVYLLSNETNLALAQGRHQEALELATRLSEAAAVIGDRDQMREAVLNLGIAHLRRGELDQAAAQLARAAEWALLTEDQRTSILVKVFQSECHRQRGELAEAKRLARTALEEAQKEQADQLVLEAELALGRACLAQAQLGDAEHHLERSRKLAGELGRRRLELEAEIALLEVALAREQPDVRVRWGELASQAMQAGFEDLREALLALLPQVREGETGEEE